MAARRLAISSLLCAEDDQPANSPPLQSSSPRFSPQSRSVTDPRLLEEPAHDTVLENGAYHSYESVRIADAAGAGRDVVPLSLQPVAVRRHTPSPNPADYRIAGSVDTLIGPAVRPNNTQHLTFDYTPYHPRRQQPQVETSYHQPLSILSEPYQYPHYSSHSPPATAYSMARPSSSRSAHSDSMSTFQPVAHPFLHAPPPHSPPQSPASAYSVPYSHRPSHSPVLSTMRPISSSPVNYYLSQPQSSYATSPPQPSYHSPHLTGSAQIISGPSSPPNSMSPVHQLSSRHSQPHIFSYGYPEPHPTPRITPGPSLQNLLSPPSPPPRSAGGLGGLEALVQAATEERRRLSGELPSARDSSPRMSVSPIIGRSRELSQPRMFQQPASPSSRILSGPAYPSDGLWRDGEPPLKKRRSSGGYSSGRGSVLPDTLHPSISPVVSGLSIPVSGSRISHSAVGEVERREQLPISVQHDWTTESDSRSSHSVQRDERESSAAQAAVATPDFDADATSFLRTREVERPKASGSAGVGGSEPSKKKGKPKTARPTSKKQAKGPPVQNGLAMQDRRHPDTLDTREQDPHEWLLEHYSTTPASPISQQFSPVQDKPSSTPSASRLNTDGYRPLAEQSLPVNVRIEPKKKPKAARVRSRTPTAVAILEQELADTPDNSSIAKLETQDPDVNLELNLAASTSVNALNAANDDAMDLDVEDELLSLLDDKPRTSHSFASKYAPSTSHHQVSHHRPKPQSGKGVSDSQSPYAGPSSSRVVPQRESMPPPISTPTGHHKEGSDAADRSEIVGVASGQKKVQKPTQRPKAPPKPKAKPAAKPKPKPPKDNGAPSASPVPSTVATSIAAAAAKSKKPSPFPASTPSTAKRSIATATGPSRSRSTSVMPGGSVGPDIDMKGATEDAEDAEDQGGIDDDKLYCVCKTKYDEDRVMIACDRCDEWYHTQCVNMPDLEVDLVDQFICPPCIESNPHLSLKTTYKRRCLRGLKHPNPSSPSACHKPARGVFSKYCSDECGVLYMQVRIDTWGGDKKRLWESVKDAEKREAVVVRVKEEPKCEVQAGGQNHLEASELVSEIVQPSKSKGEWEMARLHAQLGKIADRREELKKDMEVVVWREKLLELATSRAEHIDECGWDQRLCFGDEEYAEFGAGVIESYEEPEAQEDGDVMQVDGIAEEGEWWCKGKKKCDRHAGWQKLRHAEVSFDKETKESAILRVTAQERDIRRQIEDVNDPKARTSATSAPTSPLQPLNGKATSARIPKSKPNGDTTKKGKKKKT